MATIDDFGDVADPLGQPQLGGPTGWAAAVRDATKDKVSKVGDAMTGALTINGGDYTHLNFGNNTNGVVWQPAERCLSAVAGEVAVMDLQGALRPLRVATPVGSTDAATKEYVDTLGAGGRWGGSVNAAAHGANSMSPFNFTQLSGQWGRHDDVFYALTEGYVRVRRTGIYMFSGTLGWNWEGDVVEIPFVGPSVVHLPAEAYFRPFMWISSVSGSVSRAFGGVQIDPGLGYQGLCNMYQAAGIGGVPLNLNATITVELLAMA